MSGDLNHAKPTLGSLAAATPQPARKKHSGDWSTRKATVISVIAAAAIGLVGYLGTRTSYVPTTIFQAKDGRQPQTLADLTADSKTCDSAIRGMLLAFANEIDAKDRSGAPTDAVAKTKSLVENDLAIVPTACQKLIDPRSVASDGNLEVGVQSLRYIDGRLKAALTIHNKGPEPVALGFERYPGTDPNVGFTDDRSTAGYTRFDVRGVHTCLAPYCDDWIKNATRIGPGADAIVTVEADKEFEYSLGSNPPRTVSLALTLMNAKSDGKTETLSFGFHDVRVGN